MKKHVSFPGVDIAGLQKKNFVFISKNKLIKYKGVYPINKGDNNRIIGKVHINEFYTLIKIDKHDRKVYETSGTHIISSEILNEYVNDICFIKLNTFETLYTNWYLKKYIIQDLEFKKNILSGIIGAVIGIILTKIIG